MARPLITWPTSNKFLIQQWIPLQMSLFFKITLCNFFSFDNYEIAPNILSNFFDCRRRTVEPLLAMSFCLPQCHAIKIKSTKDLKNRKKKKEIFSRYSIILRNLGYFGN